MFTILHRIMFGRGETADQYYDRKFPELGGRHGTVVEGFDLPNPKIFPANIPQLSKASTKLRFRLTSELSDVKLKGCKKQQELRDFFARLRRHTYEEHPCLYVETMYIDCNDDMVTPDGYYADELLDNVLQFKGIPRCASVKRDPFGPPREEWQRGNPVNHYTPEQYEEAYNDNW